MHACLIPPGASVGLLGGCGFRSRPWPPQAGLQVCSYSEVVCRVFWRERVTFVHRKQESEMKCDGMCVGGVRVYI